MSNEITERTITSCYIMKVQNGDVDFFQGLQFLCGRENSASVLCSFEELATTNLLLNELRLFEILREGRMSQAVLAQRLKSEVCCLFY